MERDLNYAKRILVEKAKNPFISQTDLVYNILRDDITLSYRRLGSKINQEQLGSMLQVSRSPIRDAIQRLVEESLLIKWGKRGYYVYIPTMKDVTYVSEFRIAIEINAALLAMKRVTDEDLKVLWKDIQEQEAQDPRDLSRMITLDMRFHERLVSYSKSKYIICSHQRYTTQFRQLHNRITTVNMCGINISQHKDILSAMEEKDSRRLESAMRMHLNIAEDFMQAPECFYE